MTQTLGAFKTKTARRLESVPGKKMPKLVETTENTPPEIADYKPSGMAPEITEHANYLLGELAPDRLPEMLEGVLLRTEAMESSRIEGISSTPRSLMLAATGSKGDTDSSEAARNLQAVRHASSRANTFSVEEICEINRIIMAPYDYGGRIRKLSVYVGDDYGGPNHRDIVPLLEDWRKFLERCGADVVTKSAVAHAQFECIHPFLDGNGRTGRALTASVFAVSGKQILPLSSALRSQKDRYFEAFNRYAQSDPEPMVALHAAAVIASASAVETLCSSHGNLPDIWSEMLASERQTKQKRSVLSWLSSHPAFTLKDLANGADCGVRTAARYLAALESAEIIAKSGVKASDSSVGADRQIWEVPALHSLADDFAQTVAWNMAELSQSM